MYRDLSNNAILSPMKYYLSSYELGNETDKLKELISQTNGAFGYVPNARDYTTADLTHNQLREEKDRSDLRQCGAVVETIDLKQYFGKKKELSQKVSTLGGLYVCGGNTFVLRQALQLSGLDEILLEQQHRDDFVYIGYSAGVCVLTPNLKTYAIVDDFTDFPYPQLKEQIWDGLNLLPYAFEPHYRSDHPESASVDLEIQHCIDNKILFKAYRDGEVLVIE